MGSHLDTLKGILNMTALIRLITNTNPSVTNPHTPSLPIVYVPLHIQLLVRSIVYCNQLNDPDIPGLLQTLSEVSTPWDQWLRDVSHYYIPPPTPLGISDPKIKISVHVSI